MTTMEIHELTIERLSLIWIDRLKHVGRQAFGPYWDGTKKLEDLSPKNRENITYYLKELAEAGGEENVRETHEIVFSKATRMMASRESLKHIK